jgi:KDO2-lipid IV(A) lauroyltransferase
MQGRITPAGRRPCHLVRARPVRKTTAGCTYLIWDMPIPPTGALMRRWVKRLRKGTHRLSLAWTARFIQLVSKLTPYSLGVWAGGRLGSLAYILLPRERRKAIAHLAFVFGDRGDDWIRRTARQSFVHLGKALFELALMTPGRLSGQVEIHGLDNLRKAMEQGKGVVYVTGHIGNWEVMGSAVAAQFPLSVVAAPIKPGEVNEIIIRLRADLGYRTIVRNSPGAARELIRIFKENRILGILIDQDTKVEGAFVDFMGRPAWTPTAAASMAIKFGAPVVFGWIQREPDNRHKIFIEGPLELLHTGDNRGDIVANTAMFTKKIEECVMRNPEQWVWMHRRWKRQPPESKSAAVPQSQSLAA